MAASAPLVALWVLLAGTDPTAWVVGIPAIAGAIACASLLPRRSGAGVRPGALTRLGAAIFRDSLRGAVDVGARILARDPAIRTRVVPWKTGLRSPAARLALANAISLVPGTLTARVADDGLLIHLLDEQASWRDELSALEGRVALAFEPPASSSR